jgi:hypothetical protein
VGTAASLALLTSGAVVVWRAAEGPTSQLALSCSLVSGRLAGEKCSAVGCSKTRCVAVTAVGEVFAWEAEPSEEDGGKTDARRVPGLTRVSQIAIAEKHSLALSLLPPPQSSPFASAQCAAAARPARRRSSARFDFSTGDAESPPPSPERALTPVAAPAAGAPGSLKAIVESRLALSACVPRTCLFLADAADALDATRLRRHCLSLALGGLDAILLHNSSSNSNTHALSGVSSRTLAELERLALHGAPACPAFDLPPVAPMAPPPPNFGPPPAAALHFSSEADSGQRTRRTSVQSLLLRCDSLVSRYEPQAPSPEQFFFPSVDPQALTEEESDSAQRLLRALRKRLTELLALQERLQSADRAPLDAQQLRKLAKRHAIEAQLALLERGGREAVRAAVAAAAPEARADAKPKAAKAPAMRALPITSPPLPPPPVPVPQSPPPASPSLHSPAPSSSAATPASLSRSDAYRLRPPPPSPARRASAPVPLNMFLAGKLDVPPANGSPSNSASNPTAPASVSSPAPLRAWEAAQAGPAGGCMRDIFAAEAAAAARAADIAARRQYVSALSRSPAAALPPGETSADSQPVHVSLSDLLSRGSRGSASPSSGGGERRSAWGGAASSPRVVQSGFDIQRPSLPASAPSTKWYVPEPPARGAGAGAASLRDILSDESEKSARRARAEADEALARRLQAEEERAAAGERAAVKGRRRRGGGS